MVNWDDAAHKKMLFAMVTLLQGGRTASWDNIAAMMGEGYKANAIRQQWPKLKKECEATMGQPADSNNNGEASTPKAKRGGKKAAGEKSSGKRKSSKEDVDAELGDDEEESPSKKVKVKSEESEVEEV